MTYTCRTVCQWLGRVWAVDEVYQGKDTPPKHFTADKVKAKPKAKSKPMTLAEGQEAFQGKPVLAKGEAPKNLDEAADMFA